MKTQEKQRKMRYEGGIIAPFIIAAGVVTWIVVSVFMYNY